MQLEKLKLQFEQNGPPALFNYGGKAYAGFREDFIEESTQTLSSRYSSSSIKTYRHLPSQTLWTVTLKHYPEYNAL